MARDHVPYEIIPFSSEENQEMKDFFQGITPNYLRVGPKGYIVSEPYIENAANIYNFPLRCDDVFVVSFPKSGTTWTQELVWLILNNLDYEKAKSVTLNDRSPFLELCSFMDAKDIPPGEIGFFNQLFNPLTIDQLKELPSQRLLKSHLPFSLLPPNILEESKVVYIARDPRDVAVSYYHHYKLMRLMAPDREFKIYWNYFIKNKLPWTPYFPSVLEAWEKRNHPNMLFLFYEELSKDLSEVIRRVATFFDKKITNDQIEELREHLKIDNFKKNKSVNLQHMQDKGIFRNDGGFVRKGKVGNWREYFDEEMTTQAEEWINEHIKGTDFKFPQFL